MNEWTCLECGEQAPRNFMRCWKCGTGREGQPADPWFPDTSSISPVRTNLPPIRLRHYVIAALAWLVCCCVSVFVASWFTRLMPPTLLDQLATIAVVFLSGIIVAVVVNVLGELGTLIQKHFSDEEIDSSG